MEFILDFGTGGKNEKKRFESDMAERGRERRFLRMCAVVVAARKLYNSVYSDFAELGRTLKELDEEEEK